MNPKVHEILQKQARMNLKDPAIRMVPIQKPKIVQSSAPSIFVDGAGCFYTFDGRGLFFERGQERPIISLPDETRSAFLVQIEGVTHAFVLSTKNKLECCKLSGLSFDDRYVITRNVLQAAKTKDKIFYIFKKDDNYFVNDVSFDGARWVGKHVLANIKGIDVKLFASNGTFCIINDGVVCNSLGDELGVAGEFVHLFDSYMVVVRRQEGQPDELQHGYEVLLYDADLSLKNVLTVDAGHGGIIKCVDNIITIVSESKLYVLKVEEELVKFVDIKNYDHPIFEYDIAASQDVLSVYVLTDTAAPADRGAAKASDSLVDFVSLRDSLEETMSEGKHEDDSSMRTKSSKAYSQDSASRIGAPILDEAVRDAWAGGIPTDAPQAAPKNYLLDEVKETLSKKRALSSSENEMGHENPFGRPKSVIGSVAQQEEPVARRGSADASTASQIDRFERYMCSNEAIKMDKTVSAMLESTNTSDSPRKAASTAQKGSSPGKMKEKPAAAVASASTSKAAKPAASDSISSAMQRAICNSLEAVILENDGFIKDLIARAIVPAVEAAVNEMRIQVVAELRKMQTSRKTDVFCGKEMAFKKLLNSGMVGQALLELLKLKGSDLEALLDMIMPGVISSVDPPILIQFVGCLYGQMKKQFKDHHAKLLYDALLDIEIAELNVDELQSLSVSIRYCKDLDALDEPRYTELNSLIDITSKKIRKRVASME